MAEYPEIEEEVEEENQIEDPILEFDTERQRFLQELPRWINVLLIENFGDEDQEIENIVKVADEYGSQEWTTNAESGSIAQIEKTKTQSSIIQWKIIAFTEIDFEWKKFATLSFVPLLSEDVIQNMGPLYYPDLTRANLSPIYTDTLFPVVIRVFELHGIYLISPLDRSYLDSIGRIAQSPEVNVPPVEEFWQYFWGIQLVLILKEDITPRTWRFIPSEGETFEEASLPAIIGIYQWTHDNGLYNSGIVNQIVNYYDRQYSIGALFAGGPCPDPWGNFQRLSYDLRPEDPFRTDLNREIKVQGLVARFLFRYGCFVTKDALMAVAEQLAQNPTFCSLLKEYTYAILDGQIKIFTDYNVSAEQGRTKLYNILNWTDFDYPIPYCPKILIIAEGVNLLSITDDNQTLPDVYRRIGFLRRSDPQMGIELTINWFRFERDFNIGPEIPVFPFTQVMDCNDIPDHRLFYMKKGEFQGFNFLLGYFQKPEGYYGKHRNTFLDEYINVWMALENSDQIRDYVYLCSYKVHHIFKQTEMGITYSGSDYTLYFNGFEIFGEQIEGLTEDSDDNQRYQYFVNTLINESDQQIEAKRSMRYMFTQSLKIAFDKHSDIRNGSEFTLTLFADREYTQLFNINWKI